MKRIVFLLVFFISIVSTLIWLFYNSNQVEKVDLKVKRFEKALFSLTEDNVVQNLNEWDEKFGSFNNVFISQIMQITYSDDINYYNEILAFTKDNDMKEAYDSTAVLYSDFSDIISELEMAFGIFANEFPSYPIPDIITFFGGFNFGVVTFDDNIAIGLENFLGTNSKFYSYLGYPEYLKYQKQRRLISSNVMEVWFNEYFSKYLIDRDLLSQMIHKGKMIYFLDKMLPNVSLKDKLRFSRNQMDWIENNEASVWEYFIDNDLLFSSNQNKIRSFLNYAPFAKGMPKESPGRVAYYIGFNIVDEYMNKNKIDIEELISLDNSREFLQKSEYKPKK